MAKNMQVVYFCSRIFEKICITVWIIHHLLHHRVVQDGSHHFWVAHQLVLHSRLEIHESARVCSQSLETGQSADLIKAKRCLANIGWSANRTLWFRFWRRLDHLKFTISQRLKFAAAEFRFTSLTKCTVNPSLMLWLLSESASFMILPAKIRHSCSGSDSNFSATSALNCVRGRRKSNQMMIKHFLGRRDSELSRATA